ncbi:MAG TPA: LamB/YcsF family protein, partial [Rugosimonospora sp.]|nr:LamB/YcsF family protein [Rugosimonospora sp.]
VSRREPGALVTEPAAVVERALRMALSHEVVAADGTVVECPVESICVHGDTPGAVALAARVRLALERAGVRVHPF